MTRPAIIPPPPCPPSPHRRRGAQGERSYLPVREQHALTLAHRRLRIAVEVHAQIGPADLVAAGDEGAERPLEAALAADHDAAQPGVHGAGLDRAEHGVEGARMAS